MHHHLTSIGLTVLACALFAPGAVADSHELVEDTNPASGGELSRAEDPSADLYALESEEDEAPTTPFSTIAVPGDFSSPPTQSGMDHWNEQNPWRYGTDYLFPLTRGLDDSGLSGFLQPVAMVFTVPFDLVNLPLGAVAGLFGS